LDIDNFSDNRFGAIEAILMSIDGEFKETGLADG